MCRAVSGSSAILEPRNHCNPRNFKDVRVATCDHGAHELLTSTQRGTGVKIHSSKIVWDGRPSNCPGTAIGTQWHPVTSSDIACRFETSRDTHGMQALCTMDSDKDLLWDKGTASWTSEDKKSTWPNRYCITVDYLILGGRGEHFPSSTFPWGWR